MSRKKLQQQIHQLDQQLAVDIGLLKLQARERVIALRRVPVGWWIGGGLAAGLIAGRLTATQSTMALASRGLSLFRLASAAVSGGIGSAAAASSEL